MSPESHALARVANGAIGALVGVYAFLDDLLLGPILVAVTVWVPWYLVFGVAACALTFINIACCNWMQRSWDEWIRGYGAKLEARLEKIRRGRLLKHPFGWIARDSTVLLTIAAGLIGTVIVASAAASTSSCANTTRFTTGHSRSLSSSPAPRRTCSHSARFAG